MFLNISEKVGGWAVSFFGTILGVVYVLAVVGFIFGLFCIPFAAMKILFF